MYGAWVGLYPAKPQIRAQAGFESQHGHHKVMNILLEGLPEKEAEYVEAQAREQDVGEVVIITQAIRLYQLFREGKAVLVGVTDSPGCGIIE